MQYTKEDFVRLLNEHRLVIYKICNSYCKNPYNRDDLAQEITYQLWKSFGNFNGSVKFSTWLYRVALNVAISFYRKTLKEKPVIELTQPHTQFADTNENNVPSELHLNRLQLLINELKELDKALMILYLEEKPYSEIADILGISETNVGTRINRIKEKLKQQFFEEK